MGISQQKHESKNDVRQVFAGLANMPFVSLPDSIEEITEEWFSEQKSNIEQKIAQMKASMPAYAVAKDTRLLKDNVSRLRKFTTDVISEREKRESAKPSSVSCTPGKDPFQEKHELNQRYEDFVDYLLEKSKRDREIARQYNFIKVKH